MLFPVCPMRPFFLCVSGCTPPYGGRARSWWWHYSRASRLSLSSVEDRLSAGFPRGVRWISDVVSRRALCRGRDRSRPWSVGDEVVSVADSSSCRRSRSFRLPAEAFRHRRRPCAGVLPAGAGSCAPVSPRSLFSGPGLLAGSVFWMTFGLLMFSIAYPTPLVRVSDVLVEVSNFAFVSCWVYLGFRVKCIVSCLFHAVRPGVGGTSTSVEPRTPSSAGRIRTTRIASRPISLPMTVTWPRRLRPRASLRRTVSGRCPKAALIVAAVAGLGSAARGGRRRHCGLRRINC